MILVRKKRPDWKGERTLVRARIPTQDADSLRTLAAKQGRPVNDLVTGLVAFYVALDPSERRAP
jgi:hypothetical protein